MSAAWTTALDALEARIERQRGFVDGKGPLPDGEWDCPADPLPSAMRTRAVTLAAACDDIERRLAKIVTEHHEPLISPYR